jgi:serine/threonine-protein kinase ATR
MEEDRCLAIDMLGRLPCAAVNSLTVVRGLAEPLQSGEFLCSICDSKDIITEPWKETASREAFLTLTELISCPAFVEGYRPRISAMIAVRRLLVHLQDPNLLDVENSSLLQWFLKSLQSSIREFRVAAG